MIAPQKNVSSLVISHSSFRRQRAGAFTLIEVLASIAIIAAVLPIIMSGLSLADQTALLAKHRSQATSLAQAKLDELLVTNDFQTTSGDFGDQYPGYSWKIETKPWYSP